MEGIKILRIDVTDWLINAIRESKQHPDKSDNIWMLKDDKEIVEFELKHKDFDFNIDFDLYYDNCHVDDIDISCEIGNYSHVSDIYPGSDMIDFDDNRLDEIYSAVLSVF